jgi:hypothetical protein
MRGILIDPFAEKVQVVEVSSDFRDIYRHIQADCFTIVRLTARNEREETLYVDDNGLYVENQRFFIWHEYPQPLAGRGLILGTDMEGETVSSEMKIEEAVRKISWLRDVSFGSIRQTQGEIDHPAFGRMMSINRIPEFNVGENFDRLQASMEDVVE